MAALAPLAAAPAAPPPPSQSLPLSPSSQPFGAAPAKPFASPEAPEGAVAGAGTRRGEPVQPRRAGARAGAAAASPFSFSAPPAPAPASPFSPPAAAPFSPPAPAPAPADEDDDDDEFAFTAPDDDGAPVAPAKPPSIFGRAAAAAPVAPEFVFSPPPSRKPKRRAAASPESGLVGEEALRLHAREGAREGAGDAVLPGFRGQVQAARLQRCEAAPQSGWGDMFKRPPGQWKCDACYVWNDKDKTACASCETPKPGGGAPTPAAKPSPAAASPFTFGSPARAAAGANTGPDLLRRDAGAGQGARKKVRVLRDVDAGLRAERRQGRRAEDALRLRGCFRRAGAGAGRRRV